MTGRGSLAKRGEVVARQPRPLSAGRFWVSESVSGQLVIEWQPDGGPRSEFRLPRTLTVLVRRAAAGEEIDPREVLRVMMRAGRGG